MVRKIGLILVLVSIACIAGSVSLAQVDSLAVKVENTPAGPTILDQIASLLAALTPIMTVLVGLGLGWKYLPFMSKIPNAIIPFLNALVAFLGVFQGPAPAEAGLFGSFVHSLSPLAKTAGSFLLSGIATGFYETFLRPTLEKAGVFKPGITNRTKEMKKALAE